MAWLKPYHMNPRQVSRTRKLHKCLAMDTHWIAGLAATKQAQLPITIPVRNYYKNNLETFYFVIIFLIVPQIIPSEHNLYKIAAAA